MLPVVADAKKAIVYHERFNEDTSSVIQKQADFWGLDKEETEYLVQEIDKWNKTRRDA